MTNRERIGASGSAASRAERSVPIVGTAGDVTRSRKSRPDWQHGRRGCGGAWGRRGRGFPRPEPGAGCSDELADAAHRRPAELGRHALGRGRAVGVRRGRGTAVERRCVWATVQYLAPIRVRRPSCRWRSTSAARESRSPKRAGAATVDGQPVLLAIGTFGGDGPNDLQFSEAPEIAPPQECPVRQCRRRGTAGCSTTSSSARRRDGDARSARPSRERAHDALDAASPRGPRRRP